jgi:hypothetical protein
VNEVTPGAVDLFGADKLAGLGAVPCFDKCDGGQDLSGLPNSLEDDIDLLLKLSIWLILSTWDSHDLLTISLILRKVNTRIAVPSTARPMISCSI